MDRTERFYRIEQLLWERPSVPLQAFLDDLGISAATFKRDVEYMRDRLQVPIVWERKTRGYRLERQHGPPQALPGLWFSASEIHALFTMRRLLEDLQPGLLDPHVRPFLDRLNRLLGAGSSHQPEVERRVRVFHVARRPVDLQHFGTIATALFKRRKLRIGHFNRSSGETTERTVSPQRLAHYRENWYLDAWCELREAIRSFAVDAVQTAELLDESAIDLPDDELDRHFASGYGIFSGHRVAWAVLRFSPDRARWVGQEIWHPEQRGRFEEDGSYRLEIPYSDERELLMDILRHGAGVEVLAPSGLRKQLRKILEVMINRYT